MAKAIQSEVETVKEFDMRIFEPEKILDQKFFDNHGNTFKVLQHTADMGFILLNGLDKEESFTGEEIIGLSGKNGLIAQKTKEFKRKKKTKNKNQVMSELKELMMQDTQIRNDMKRLLALYKRVIDRHCIVDDKEILMDSLQMFSNQL